MEFLPQSGDSKIDQSERILANGEGSWKPEEEEMHYQYPATGLPIVIDYGLTLVVTFRSRLCISRRERYLPTVSVPYTHTSGLGIIVICLEPRFRPHLIST